MESGQLHLSPESEILATMHHVFVAIICGHCIVPVHCAYCQDTLRGDEDQP